MSLEAARSFREQVSANPELQNKLLNNPDIDLLALGEQHGFEFTPEEGQTVLSEMQDGELSDFELEWVSGGGIATSIASEVRNGVHMVGNGVSASLSAIRAGGNIVENKG